jgi:hypothetical protein
LIGDAGVVLDVDADNGIRVNVVGDPLSLRALCEPLAIFRTPNFIRTINGCPPDVHGNFNLTVGDHQDPQTILRIYPKDSGIAIEMIGNPTTQVNVK